MCQRWNERSSISSFRSSDNVLFHPLQWLLLLEQHTHTFNTSCPTRYITLQINWVWVCDSIRFLRMNRLTMNLANFLFLYTQHMQRPLFYSQLSARFRYWSSDFQSDRLMKLSNRVSFKEFVRFVSSLSAFCLRSACLHSACTLKYEKENENEETFHQSAFLQHTLMKNRNKLTIDIKENSRNSS